MELNADFSRRVAVRAAPLAWVPSPTTDIHRRMLDRIGDEVAPGNVNCSLAPNSRFAEHSMAAAKSFVLEGVSE